jgi:hypothetical protein
MHEPRHVPILVDFHAGHGRLGCERLGVVALNQ